MKFFEKYIDKDIAGQKKKGKIKEAEYLEKNKDKIVYLWQPNNLWLYILEQKHSPAFWLIILFLIFLILYLSN